MIKKFWNWLAVSSADPSEVAMTVKGITSLAAVQFIFSTILPALGVHVAFDLNSFGDALYNIVYGGLTVISGLVLVVGLLRKVINSFVPPQGPTTPSV